jgi:hypothetical protein
MDKNLFKKLKLALGAITLFVMQINAQTTFTYNFTGSVQTFTVPSCVSSITLDVRGAQGGSNANNAVIGGLGGTAYGVLSVTPGDILNIYVGGTNGYNGGGSPGVSPCALAMGGFGGGATDIRLNGNALANRVIVGAGGGGAGGDRKNGCGRGTGGGGGGGYYGGGGGSGYPSSSLVVPTGGTQTSGGAAGTSGFSATQNGTAGALGIGGNGGLETSSSQAGDNTAFPGGAGGGLVGANGQQPATNIFTGQSGAGGSSYIGGVSSGSTATGARSGIGLVIISYDFNGGVITATASKTLSCAGSNVTLTAIGPVSNYTWSNGSNSSSLVVSPTTNTFYSVSSTNSVNCVSTSSIAITVNPGLPTLSVVSSTNQTCLGKTATLTASGAVTYTWSNGVTNGVSFFPQSTNTYTVTGENGCGTVTAVSTITISPLPITVAASSTVVCTNNTATLSATASATSYTWQPGNVIGASPNLIINPQVNTTYTISATDGTCVGVTNVFIQADPVPTIQIVSNATIACSGDALTFTATGGNSYTWTSNNNQTGANITVNPTVTTLFTVVGDNSFGCKSNASQVVSIVLPPNINVATASPSVCAGSSSTLNVTGANSFTWTGGSNGNALVVNPNQTTVYSVDGSNTGNPCIATRTLEITVFTPSLTISGNTTICNGAQTNLTAGGATTYSWTHDAPFYNANTSVSPNSNAIYTVNATHEFNSGQVKCPISGTVEVIVNAIPTVSVIPTRSAMCVKETNTLSANGASTYTWVTSNTTIAAPSITINPINATILTYTLNGTSTQGCEGSNVYLLNVSICNGINEINDPNGKVNLYPNPSNGNFSIETEQDSEFKLMNQLGQVIQVINLTQENNFKTSVNQLSQGVYFISGNGIIKKIIVQ